MISFLFLFLAENSLIPKNNSEIYRRSCVRRWYQKNAHKYLPHTSKVLMFSDFFNKYFQISQKSFHSWQFDDPEGPWSTWWSYNFSTTPSQNMEFEQNLSTLSFTWRHLKWNSSCSELTTFRGPGVHKGHEGLRFPRGPVVLRVPGVLLIPGSWNYETLTDCVNISKRSEAHKIFF